MNLIDGVWSLANEFVDKAKLITLNAGAIEETADTVAIWKRENPMVYQGWPKCINPEDNRAMLKLFLYELMANSINYCYWYGRHNIRPNGSDCGKMYRLLDESFEYLEELRKTATIDSRQEKEIITKTFIEKLSMARFPLIDHRVRHLNEILSRSDLLSVIEISVSREDYSVEQWLDYLITSFPGYSKDLFLKRAFLFIMQMYRRCGIFGKEISKVLVPADYQIPKMLRWLGCIEYHNVLAFTVDNDLLMAEDCSTECEIRAATIVACKRIADLADCTCEEVDTYLYGKRYVCSDPFHLTITANY